MLWPLARPRRTRNVAVQERLAQARRDNPEAEAWLGLLEAALDESEDGARWEAALPSVAADRPVKAPLLCRAQVRVDGRTVRTWVRRLLDLAPQVNGGRRDMDGLALLAAAVCQDDARSDALAAAAGADAQAVRVVGQMAAVPLLQACARGLASQIPASWWEGYCPVCGRCGTGWAIPLLRCVFCDEIQHDNLAYLAPEEGEQTRRVEVCQTCKGYLKGVTTVRPSAAWSILIDDLMTVHLDVAALERGYRRPERPGYALEARIQDGGGWWRLWRPA